LVFAATSTTRAQLPVLDPLANCIAESIVKAKRKSVIVLDFSGLTKDTALGRTLTEIPQLFAK
jgi:hypothetical protein